MVFGQKNESLEVLNQKNNFEWIRRIFCLTFFHGVLVCAESNPASVVISHLRDLGISENKLPINDRDYRVSAKGELIRAGTITLDPKQSPEPLTLLSLLVHETNHARRWISHGDRRWDFSKPRKFPTFEEFSKTNQLNVAGDEALAHLRAAKFSERNKIPLSDTEKQVLEIAKQKKPLSETVQDLRKFLTEKPEYFYQHEQLLKFLYEAAREENEIRRRVSPKSYSSLTSADLMSLSRLRKQGVVPPLKECSTLFRALWPSRIFK